MICLWDLTSKDKNYEALVIIKGQLSKGIKNVCFSSDGSRIAAIALDLSHCIAIYDVKKLIEVLYEFKF
jgi:hypothetical protein